MSTFTIVMDGRPVKVTAGQTILQVARQNGVDIPTLCYLEKCGPLNTCQVCLVKLAGNGPGRLAPSCATPVAPGMVVESETEEVHEARRTALELLFSDHVGDCLSPCHRLCPLQLNIPAMLRQVEAGQLDEAVATMRQALPLAGVLGRLCHHPCEQGCRRGDFDQPAAIREMERFLSAHEQRSGPATKRLTERFAAGKPSVVVVGAGPAGLTAAHDLARRGHAVTVIDRHAKAGGRLRELAESELPAEILEAELAVLAGMGIDFKTGIELGNQTTLDGLQRGFDAILLTVGELGGSDGEKLEVPLAGGAVKADPATCRAGPPNVFAAGACVKPVKQLIRAMAEGRAAAECVHRYLIGLPPRRPERPFSSVMGRLAPGELRQFLRNASQEQSAPPCDRCSGLNRGEALREASRCLHCDCPSSGHCLLQHYAEVYGADANRYRAGRRPFERQAQRAGVVFEPGKCILCGICVRLTEMAADPLGLTFAGRGFEARLAAPFGHSIEEGLGRVAEECVRHCPTGALMFAEKKAAPQPA